MCKERGGRRLTGLSCSVVHRSRAAEPSCKFGHRAPGGSLLLRKDDTQIIWLKRKLQPVVAVQDVSSSSSLKGS